MFLTPEEKCQNLRHARGSSQRRWGGNVPIGVSGLHPLPLPLLVLLVVLVLVLFVPMLLFVFVGVCRRGRRSKKQELKPKPGTYRLKARSATSGRPGKQRGGVGD